MKKQLQKFKLLAVFLAIAGMLLSSYSYSAVSISGTLTISSNSTNYPIGPSGIQIVAQKIKAGNVIGTYSAYTNTSLQYAFGGLPDLATGETYSVRASVNLFYGLPEVISTLGSGSYTKNLFIIFNKAGFEGGNGGFPLWEQFLSSASYSGTQLGDGDQIAIYNDLACTQCVGVIIFTSGLVTSNVFDPANKLIAYSTLAAIPGGNQFPAGYSSGNVSYYKLWKLVGAVYTAYTDVTPARFNIDGVCYLENTFPGAGLYVHSVTSLDFGVSAYNAQFTINDSWSGATSYINGANVQLLKNGTVLFSGLTNASGQVTLSNVADGNYTLVISKAGYTTLTKASYGIHNAGPYPEALSPTGAISGNITEAGTGTGIVQALVTVIDASGKSQTALTGMYGSYTIGSLSNGAYYVTAQKTGSYNLSSTNTLVSSGLTTNGVNLALTPADSHFDAVSGDPLQTWTIYLAQARIGSNDLVAGDEIAIFDVNGGTQTIAGKYKLVEVLTPGTALNHDMVAFKLVTPPNSTGFVPGRAYTFQCYQKSTTNYYGLGSFSIDATSSWIDKDHSPDASSTLTKYSIVTLNFLDYNPSNVQQNIYLRQGVNWISSYITPAASLFQEIIPPTHYLWAGNGPGTWSANTGSPLQYVQDDWGTQFGVTTNYVAGPPVVPTALTNNITYYAGGKWNNKAGYMFYMNSANSLIITGTRYDASTNIHVAPGFWFVGNLLGNSINAATAFKQLITAGTLSSSVNYIKNSDGRMFWMIGGTLVNNIGNVIPGQAYQFFVAPGAGVDFVYQTTKSGDLVDEDYSTSHFIVNGNAGDKVFTIYVKTSDFTAGDEIAAFDGDKLVGSTKLISTTGTFSNPIPAFMTLTTGEGFVPGHAYTLKAWNASENKEYDVTFTLENTDGAYYNTVYPNSDGKFCIATVKKSTLGINDASGIVANIYPNPAHDYLKVVADRTIDKLTLMNIMGQKVAEKSVDASTAQLNTSSIKAGVYFLRIECNGQVSTQKVVIQ